MERGSWSLRVLWIIVLIVVVIVIRVYTTVDDCCDGTDTGPGRGPIIVVEPTGSSPTLTNWSLGSSSSSTSPITSWGNDTELREDLFGMIESMVAADENPPSTEFAVSQATLTVDDSGGIRHMLVIERTTTGQVAWSLDGSPLIACDFSTASSPPNCTGVGIPAAFHGTIVSFTTVPATSAPSGTDPTSVKYLKIQAKQ